MNEKSVITLVPVVGHIKLINHREPGKKQFNVNNEWYFYFSIKTVKLCIPTQFENLNFIWSQLPEFNVHFVQ